MAGGQSHRTSTPEKLAAPYVRSNSNNEAHQALYKPRLLALRYEFFQFFLLLERVSPPGRARYQNPVRDCPAGPVPG